MRLNSSFNGACCAAPAGLARVVPRAAAHRVPAPLAGPVGIFRFVVRGSGRGGRQCGRHRQYADQDSHNHGVFSLRECWERSIVAAGCRRKAVPGRGGKAVPPLQPGFPRRNADVETSGSNFRRDAEGPQISWNVGRRWRPRPSGRNDGLGLTATFHAGPEQASPRRVGPHGLGCGIAFASMTRIVHDITVSPLAGSIHLSCCPAKLNTPPSAAAEKVEPVLEPVVTSRGRGTKDHHRRWAKQETALWLIKTYLTVSPRRIVSPCRATCGRSRPARLEVLNSCTFLRYLCRHRAREKFS